MASIKPTPDLRPARINALGEFAASIAHEVKQPLAAVTLNAQACLHWLEQDPPHLDQARAALRMVLEASTAASAMVRSLHGMACQSAPQRTSLVINDVVRDVLQLLRSELRRQCITVTEIYAPDFQLHADRVQLMQVVMNLIVNAIEAARDLHDRPRMLTLHTALADDGLRISVADNGVGIVPALAERIFDPLFSTKPGGTGMGLAICRNIVQSHGGRIWNEPGQPHGTVFHLSFKEYTLCTPSRS